MAWTREGQSGAELNTVAELDEFDNISGTNITSMTISNTKARTGTYSWANPSGAVRCRGLSLNSNTQIRGNVYVNHTDLQNTATSNAGVLQFRSSIPIEVMWNGGANALQLYVNSVLQDSIDEAVAGFTTTNVWYSLGFAFKADATTGFISIYLDGIQILTFSGNTGTGIIQAAFGGCADSFSTAWASTVYWDDFYVDSSDGSEADAAPPSPRFEFKLANAAGTLTNWTPVSGTNVSNVDDPVASGGNDSDTTYVYAQAAALQDSYNTADYTLAPGTAIAAVIPVAVARKTDAAVASTLKVGNYNGTANLGSAQTLPTSYGVVWERQTLDPSSAIWTESTVNSNEVIVESAGVYA